MAAISLIFLLLAGPAQAETTDWLRGYDALKVGNKMNRQGLTLMAIQCRDTNRIGLNVGTFDYRLTFQKLPEAKKFLWAVGSELGVIERLRVNADTSV